MAQAATGKDNTAIAVGLSLALGLGVLALTAGLYFFRSTGTEMEFRPILPVIIMVLIVLFGAVAAIAARR